jgi:N-hydroxyarylamine O-acetyltransferase
VDLTNYLTRIGYEGGVKPDLECLTRIHRCHALSVPYENLDVQLERPMDLNVERIFEKIVTRKRGGWCYEQNGLLGWALSEIGFDVTRCTGAVDRRDFGDEKIGNHLVLHVQLDGSYLCDLGIGDGIRVPITLQAGLHQQGELEFRLEILDDGFWRFHNHSLASPATFDFKTGVADEALFEAKNQFLQTSQESGFVQNLCCLKMHDTSVTCLTGQVLSHITQNGETKTLITTATDLVETLAEVFGIEEPEAARIWPKVQARHKALFGNTSIDEINLTGL